MNSYGGVLVALVATFLSDVMNSDPQVVHYVHKSGLAKSFLSLLMDNANKEGGSEEEGDEEPVPILKPSAELIMALPNVSKSKNLYFSMITLCYFLVLNAYLHTKTGYYGTLAYRGGCQGSSRGKSFSIDASIFCSPSYVLLVSFMHTFAF